MLRRPILIALTAVYVVIICLLTLTPQPVDPDRTPLLVRLVNFLSQYRLTAWLTFDVVEKLANIALFVPLGFLIVLLSRRWWIGILVGVAFTLLIEGVQATLLAATRFATVSDLVMNTLGACVGSGLAVLIQPRGTEAERG
jgi:glycopeptide antibiotics resistance protein